VFTNKDGQQAVEQVVKDVTFVEHPGWFDRLLNHVLPTIHAPLKLFCKHIDIVYSSSDFFSDVPPSFVYTGLHGYNVSSTLSQAIAYALAYAQDSCTSYRRWQTISGGT
jgi:hypothetical protein